MVAPLSLPPAVGTELPQHYAGCFGCGDHPAGLRMRFRVVAEHTVGCDLVLARHHQGAPGIAHGGLVAAAFDEALGAAQVFSGELAVTASLTTDFRAPVPVEVPLHLRARLDGREGRELRISAELRRDDADGARLATAHALFLTVPPEHFAPYAD